MLDFMWKGLAFVVSHPKVADYLIKRSQRTPYFNLEGYMNRWWLFNRYTEIGGPKVVPKLFPFLPSVRIHHILREDFARDMHDHPWNARTIILKGDYDEERMHERFDGKKHIEDYRRTAGDTATLNFGEYHNITRVSHGGVWTMFITYKYQGTWGFWVNGRKVPHTEYVQA